MSDQYNLPNASNPAPLFRAASQSDVMTQAPHAPVYSAGSGLGPGLLVISVFVVVAIMASTLSDFHQWNVAADTNGAVNAMAPAATSNP